ncbi:MAG TPA: hypothetical protein VJ183_10260 [Chloroflexia bacterium]|nr:hypothetical protein [Chloroflexia bacterium]
MKKKTPLILTDPGSAPKLAQARRTLLRRIRHYPIPVLFLVLVILLGLASLLAVGVLQGVSFVNSLMNGRTWDFRNIRILAECLILGMVGLAFAVTYIKRILDKTDHDN